MSLLQKQCYKANKIETYEKRFSPVVLACLPESKSNGSIKKAGKVARTSYSHSSIENIIFNKNGI